MSTRFLAILILLLPTLSGVGALVRQDGHAGTASGCCEIVEVVSCCGKVSYEKTCPASGGECQCAASPADMPIPSSLPLLPLTLGSMTYKIPPSKELLFEAAVEAPTARLLGIDTLKNNDPSHNQAQAILGVWRI